MRSSLAMEVLLLVGVIGASMGGGHRFGDVSTLAMLVGVGDEGLVLVRQVDDDQADVARRCRFLRAVSVFDDWRCR